jgi:hypothetical protein
MNYIPITFDCEGANTLRSNGIRENAFPFDWNIAPLHNIYNLIKNNFEGFLDPKSLIYSNKPFTHKYDNEYEVNNLIPVFDTKYGFLFIHDFTLDNNYDIIYKKYKKRIDYFKHSVKNKENTFVYCGFNIDYITNIYSKWVPYFDDPTIFDFNILNLGKYDLKDFENLITKKYKKNNLYKYISEI